MLLCRYLRCSRPIEILFIYQNAKGASTPEGAGCNSKKKAEELMRRDITAY